MHTLGSLRTAALGWLDETSNTSTTYTNITNAINMANHQRCTEQAWSFMLWRQPETFSLVAGQRRYNLHPMMQKPLYVRNQTTKEYLIETPWRQMQAADPRWETAVTGNRFVFVEPSPVAVQPTTVAPVVPPGSEAPTTTTTNLTIESTSPSDTNAAQGVVIEGLSGGVLVEETVVPSGTSPVMTTYGYDPGGIISVVKKASWSGQMTLKQGTTTLLILNHDELFRQHPQIELLWTPSKTDTIEYRFYRTPRELTDANDIPDIPQEFAYLLVWDALIMFAAYDGDITQARLQAWIDQREKLLTQMAHTFLDGSTVGAEPRYVRNMDDDGYVFPTVNS